MIIENQLNIIGARIVELTRVKLDTYQLSGSDLYKDISYRVEESDDIYELVIKLPSYAVNVDKGRKPGARMPPAKPINDWIKSKGIPKSASFAIRKSISVRGIKPRPFLDVITKYITNIDDILFDFAEEEITVELNSILDKLNKII